MSENQLLHQRISPPREVLPSPVTPPRPTHLDPPDFSFRNSPADLLCRSLWQLVGVYVFVVLLVKDRRLPR
ncbi:MAG: hypothetical protein ABWY68_00645 [Cryobacterium sp.]